MRLNLFLTLICFFKTPEQVKRLAKSRSLNLL